MIQKKKIQQENLAQWKAENRKIRNKERTW